MKRAKWLLGLVLAVALYGVFQAMRHASLKATATRYQALVRAGDHEGLADLFSREGMEALRSSPGLQGEVLFRAVEADEGLLRRMLEAGLDPNAPPPEAGTPLFHAANLNRLPAVELLLRHGAQPHVRSGLRGSPPLMGPLYAQLLANGDTRPGDGREVLQSLLQAGAEVNQTEGRSGGTVLHLAAAYGSPAVLRLLLQRGANVDALDGEGRSVLSYAVQSGEVERARLLLEAGHRPTASFLKGTEEPCPFAEFSAVSQKEVTACRRETLRLIAHRRKAHGRKAH